MRRIKFPRDAALFAFLGLLGLVLAGSVIAGKIGMGHFLAGLCFLGAFAMYWVQRRLSSTWPVEEPDIAIRAGDTRRYVKRVGWLLIALGVLSLILQYV